MSTLGKYDPMYYKDKLSDLQETLGAEQLLSEIIVSMSSDEARETFLHICRHYDIDEDSVGE